MDYGDYNWGRDYYRDPFPHSLVSTREYKKSEPKSSPVASTSQVAPIRISGRAENQRKGSWFGARVYKSQTLYTRYYSYNSA